MRAIAIGRHGGIEEVAVVDVAEPQPADGQVRVRLRAAALNHLDLFVIGGIAGLDPPMPHVIGADGAGVIDAVGEGVTSLKVGDEVVLDPGLGSPDEPGYGLLGEMVPGTFADAVVVPADSCHAKPARLSWQQAAAFPLVTLTAWRMLVSKASVQPGEWVLIHGIGGGVSLAALQICMHVGARTIVTSHNEAKRRRAVELGADVAVDYTSEDVVAAVREHTGKVGADVVVDNVGEATFDASIRACRKGGRIVTCGATSGPQIPVDVRRVFWKQLSILGSTMGDSREFAAMLEVVAEGGIAPVVDRVFALEEAPAALRRLADAQQFGKIVLDISDR